MAARPDTLDIFQLEYRAVRLRNSLFFRLVPKGDRGRRKYFVIGHPRTGTLALHKIFEANGIRAQHSSGNWKTWRYDAFSDRGNYQPFELFARRYPNARFVLNTRPADGYIRSRMNHIARSRGRKGLPGARFTSSHVRNELLQRNHYFLRVIRHFSGTDRLTVINIHRPGAMAFVCQRLGLDFPGDAPSKPPARQVLTERDLENIDAAFDELGLTEQKMNPFIFPELLDDDDNRFLQDFLQRHQQAVHI